MVDIKTQIEQERIKEPRDRLPLADFLNTENDMRIAIQKLIETVERMEVEIIDLKKK